MGIKLFILYFTAIFGSIIALQLAILAVVLYFSGAEAQSVQVLIATGIALLWAITGIWRICKGDHEMRIEVAKKLYPLSFLYTLASCIGFTILLKVNIPESGNNPFLMLIVAIPCCIYICIRWSETRFLRSLKD